VSFGSLTVEGSSSICVERQGYAAPAVEGQL